MKQICQQAGRIQVLETPVPDVPARGLLVKTAFSCISAGTELAGLGYAAQPMWKKALKHPEKVQKALKMMQERGIRDTWKKAKGEFDPPHALGYSAAGVVVAVGDQVTGFAPGDRVACAGAGYASHADYIAVPVNLATIIPENVEFDQASTVAIGGIALQALRRAGCQLGETVIIVGLGLIGYLLVQLAKSAGLTVIAIDTDERRRSLATESGADHVLDGDPATCLKDTAFLTGHAGADAVFVCAGSNGRELANIAVEMTRRKGKIVIVGDARIDIDRGPLYQREADLLISTSYGPGRYDPDYEILGQDYPADFVRWTENRNMQAYLQQMQQGRLSLDVSSIARVMASTDAPALYQDLQTVSPDRPLFGLLAYDHNTDDAPLPDTRTATVGKAGLSRPIRLGLIGAGAFAQGLHLPKLSAHKDFEISSICTRQPAVAKGLATSFGLDSFTANPQEIISDPGTDLVYITTRHDSHAALVMAALEAGKHVFVEKPLALSDEDFRAITELHKSRPDQVLFVGMNRRFAPATRALQDALKNCRGPMVITYQMNALPLPNNHWTRGPQGGGRNLGEACHIYDLFAALTNAAPLRSQGMTITGPLPDIADKQENFSAQIAYEDGSLAHLIYTSKGHSRIAKEIARVFVDGHIFDLTWTEVKDTLTDTILWQGDENKGHELMLDALSVAIKDPEAWNTGIGAAQVRASSLALAVECDFWQGNKN